MPASGMEALDMGKAKSNEQRQNPKAGDWVAHSPSGQLIAHSESFEKLGQLVHKQKLDFSKVLVFQVAADDSFCGGELDWSEITE